MEIQSLHVTNLRTFRGNHTFDFSPRKGPIILIGGKNGSGKTTLMEAVKLCLYGQSAFPRRISRAKYEQQLGQRIHNNRDATVSLNNAAVKLDFTHFRNGSLEHYQVTRSWQKNGSSVKEQLRIDLNGKLMMGLPQERWQDFLHDLVPSGLTELFFFDGERIQALAEDIAEESPTNERHIGVAIKQLLSLDVVEKLQTDLDIYAYRQRKDGTGDDESPLEQLIAERGALQERLENLHAERAQTQTKLDAAAGEMERAERAISSESQGYGSQRVNMKTELAQVEAALDSTREKIRELTTGLLPFALIPELCLELQSELDEEAENHKRVAAREVSKDWEKYLREQTDSEEFWEGFPDTITKDNRMLLQTRLRDAVRGKVQAQSGSKVPVLLHGLSAKEHGSLESWMRDARQKIPDKVIVLGNTLEELVRKRERLVQDLKKVPDDDALAEIIGPIMEDLKQLHKDGAQLDVLAEKQSEEIRRVMHGIEDIKRRTGKAYEDVKGSSTVENKLVLVHRVKEVLDKFLNAVTQDKLAQLETLVTARFRELIRKPDLALQIKIDPHRFDVTVLDSNGSNHPSEALSAGEKEIFAISVLWALRQLSGRPLPVMIDTPLARLDGDHRTNLVEKYFPFTSHQVVLFSTDTEVDQGFFRDLKPQISHSYHLQYVPDEHATAVREGYFWEQQPDESK